MSIVLLLTVQTLHCGVVWDAAGHAFTDGRIAFDGERIQAVGPASKVPAAPNEIDLRPLFCMPGLVDAHTHVTSYVEHKGDTEAIRRQWAVRNARETLENGVTAGRDLGDDYDDGLWIRDQINAGKVVGPRLQVAGEQIGPEPAHQKMTPDQLRELVRQHVKKGVDVIKLFATTGMGGTERFLSKEQLVAAVDEAHKLKRRVAVHVIGHDACVDVVAAGADSVEHGDGVDVALAREMKKKGVYFTPTLYILRYYVEDAPNIEFTQEEVEHLKHSIATVVEPFEKRFPDIIKTGVTIVAGSDSFMKLHGKNSMELVYLVKAGLPAERALEAMTKVSAELMGWGDRIGTLQAGRFADVIAVEGDPRKDIASIRKVHFVMKGGQIVRR